MVEYTSRNVISIVNRGAYYSNMIIICGISIHNEVLPTIIQSGVKYIVNIEIRLILFHISIICFSIYNIPGSVLPHTL